MGFSGVPSTGSAISILVKELSSEGGVIIMSN